MAIKTQDSGATWASFILGYVLEFRDTYNTDQKACDNITERKDY